MIRATHYHKMCSHPFSRSKDLELTDAHIQPLTRKFTRRHTVGLVVVVLVVLVEEVGLEVMLLVLMSSLPPERHLFEHLQALQAAGRSDEEEEEEEDDDDVNMETRAK